MNLFDTIITERPTGSWLYHYTSKSGLLGIFETGAVWATSIHYMNDSKEFSHAMDMVKTSLHELSGIADEHKAILTAILTDVMQSVRNLFVFVFSLSEEQDLLSQWRAYSGTGGFSIEFECDKLIEFAHKYGFRLCRCIYDNDDQRTIINEILQESKDTYFDCLVNNLNDDEIHYTVSGFFRGRFITISPLLKHHAFSEEKEWRLVSYPTRIDSPHVKYREGASMLIPYFDLNIRDVDKNFPVRGIIVGPCPHPELSANSALHFITSRGNFQGLGIRHSNAPYREW